MNEQRMERMSHGQVKTSGARGYAKPLGWVGEGVGGCLCPGFVCTG